MSIGVLGSLTYDGSTAFGRRDRAVLTALAMCVGQRLTADQLADAVWGDELPASSHKALQGCVGRLRRVLGAEKIETSGQGYRLVVPPDDVDAQHFERTVTRSRELLALGEPERAAYLLAQSLSLWRGRAFEDVEGWDRAIIEAGRLDELRLEAEELRVDACLRSGRHQEVLAAAESMVKASPLRERRWFLLSWAQYQAGRQTEALRTIHRVKRLLADQLGLDPGPELAALEEAILRQDDALMSEGGLRTSTSCPYQGLTPYDVDDSESFFGRDSDLIVCLDLLSRQRALTVVGPSGCGKSSLVRAGIAAALGRDGRAVAVMTPGEHPMQSVTALDPGRETVLLVDQCEETFSLCSDDAERDAFFTWLVDFAEHGVLILALRADRLAGVSAHPGFARLVERSLHLLGGMSEQGLREAIEEPARQAGLLIEPGLVDLLVGEVEDTPGALPMLSHALLETWTRREGNTLTVAGYAATGGIRGAVAQSAESVYSSIEPAQRHVLRDLVLRLVTSGSESEPVRRPVPRRLLSGDSEHERMIDLLVSSRLVTSDAGVVEIAHEALARAWPRLRAWLDDDVEGQRILHHLSGAADAWDSLGRPDSELYRGVRLTQALQWQAEQDTTLTDTEVAFLEAAEKNDRNERRAAEVRARAQTRMIRRLRGVLAGAAVLLVVALVAGALAVHQADRADDNALAADARRVGAKALATDDIGMSMLLAVAGARLDDSPATRSNLLAVLTQRPQLIRSTSYDGDKIVGLEVSPDGRTVAVYDLSGQVTLYDATTMEVQHTFPGGDLSPYKWFAPMAFSPDGATLAVGMPPLSPTPILLLDGHTLEPLPVQLSDLPASGARVADITYSADGTSLASVIQRLEEEDGFWDTVGSDLLVWDLTGTGAPSLSMRRTSVCHRDFGHRCLVALSPGGDVVYTSTPLRAYDVASQKPTYSPAPDIYAAGVLRRTNFFDLSPDGSLLAMGVEPDRLLLVDATSGKVLRVLRGHAEAVLAVRFSADGTKLASSSADRTTIVWDVTTGEIFERLQLGDGDSQGLAFSPDDATLYSGGSDRAVREWDLHGQRRFVSMVVEPDHDFATGASPSPGGRFASDNRWFGGLRFLDVSTQAWTPLVANGLGLQPGAWNHAGDRYATVGVDAAGSQSLWIWDPITGDVVVERSFSRPELIGAAFSQDDTLVSVTDKAGRISLLDARTLEPVTADVQLEGTGSGGLLGPDNRTALFFRPGYQPDRTFEHPSQGWLLLDLLTGETVNEGDVGFDPDWFARSPDGLRAAIVGKAGEVVIIDLASGEPLRPPVVGHQGPGWSVSYSPDGSRVLTAAYDGSVSLWDATTGELLGTVVMPVRVRATADFAADGHSAVIVSDVAGVYLWDTSIDHALEFACRLAGRDLTQVEWRESFGDRPYEETCPAAT